MVKHIQKQEKKTVTTSDIMFKTHINLEFLLRLGHTFTREDVKNISNSIRKWANEVKKLE